MHHITARDNVILNNKWGRQMSVVGGRDILYENNRLSNNLGGGARLYIAQESSYATYGVRDVIARHNTLTSCGSRANGHGAVMVFTSEEIPTVDPADITVANISLVRNDVQQNGLTGIRIFGDRVIGGTLTVDSNRLQGASPETDIAVPGGAI